MFTILVKEIAAAEDSCLRGQSYSASPGCPRNLMVDILEKAALVALLRQRVNSRRWRLLVEHVEALGSALAVLEGREAPGCVVQLDLFEEFSPPPMERLEKIADEIHAWEAKGLTFVTVLDEAYPVNLRAVYDRPPFLFIRGVLCPEDDKSVAVVGTRKPTPDGLRRARKLAAELVGAGVTVVSGLALGIDTAAHRAALRAGGRTLAVIGTGITRCYPPQNRALQDEIARKGAVLSQFWPDDPPARPRFPLRNAVMSGLALATVIVEASETSGARIQAEFALKQGRPVFLLRSLLEKEWARKFAQKPGVTVVDHLCDLMVPLEKLLHPSAELVA
jgi:DNA processing protein